MNFKGMDSHGQFYSIFKNDQERRALFIIKEEKYLDYI